MQNCSFFSLFQYFKGRLRGEAANPHLIAFSLSPYSLQQQCCGFYVVARKGGWCYSCYSCVSRTSSTRGARALRYILLKKTEKHTICSICKTIFNKKCSVRNTLFIQKCCVYKTFFVILQRISLFNQQSEQL